MPPKQQQPKTSAISLEDIAAKLDAMETRLDQLPAKVSEEVSMHIEELNTKLASCIEKVDRLEESTNLKLQNLEKENNVLRRQINRLDVIISGVPTSLTSDELYALILKIGERYGVNITMADISMCNFINRKSILVKFNTAFKKDSLMKLYYEKKDLKLCEIYDKADGLESRVFLNHNLTPVASKVHYICRQLLRNGKIKKFRVLNLDLPKAKLTFNDDVEKTLLAEELFLFYNKAARSINAQQQDINRIEEVN